MDPITIALGLAELVPAVAGWLGGDKVEDRARTVVDAAKKVTGAADGAAALDALRANPALAMDFQREVTARMEARLRDRADARARDVRVQELRGRNTRADVLAIASILGLIGLIWTLLFVEVPDGPARDVLLILSGALVAIVKDVYGFEFGSSRGSKEKDGLLSPFREAP